MTVSSSTDETRVAPLAGWRPAPWMLGWALGGVILIAMFGADALSQTFHEPDSAMRLVQVRDFLNGQGWYDLTQYRLNPPDGVPMHWARWVDAAIAAPIALLGPMIGREAAEIAVAFAWPLGWLAAFVYLMTRIAGELAEDEASRPKVAIAAAIVAALAFPALDRFAPGAFDHHNIELVTIAAAIWLMMKMDRRPELGALAGGALGVAVATAAEGLPFLAVGAVVAGLLWVARPIAYARGLFWFGVGVGGVMLLSFVALVRPSQWSAPQCDAMSSSFLWIGLATAAVAIVMGRAGPVQWLGTPVRRLVFAAGLGAAAGGVLLAVAPGCLGGGYGDVSPDMKRLWMAQISEARPLAQVWGDNLAAFFAIGGAALAGFVFAGVTLVRRPQAASVWIAGGFLLGAVVLMVWQVRGASFATAFAIPFAANMIVRAQTAYRAALTMRALGAFALVAVISTAAGWSMIGQQAQKLATPSGVLSDYAARETDARACFDGEGLAQLDVEPSGLLLNQFAIGSGVLEASHHSVLAAPYHRNAAGTLAAVNAFRSTPDAAREIVTQTGASHVLVCEGLPEAQFYVDHPAEGVTPEQTLAYALEAGVVPEWLELVGASDSPVRLYRVRDEAAPGLRGRF